MTKPHIVIVGGSLGGLRAAESIRAAGISSPITIVGGESHMPYNRPPLSKEFLKSGSATGDAVEPPYFRIRPDLTDVGWRLGCRAKSVDIAKRYLHLEDGEKITFDAMVVATGLRPRRLPVQAAHAHRYVCRTIDDAIAIKRRIQPGLKVVVAGGGFLGCELTATLSELGAQVTVVEPLGLPMERALGSGLARAFLRLHSNRGVEFRLGRSISKIAPTKQGAIDHILLDDGERLQADIVLETLGSHANVEWLEGNGLDLSDGILCDRDMRVVGADHVLAVGDVARFPNDFVDGVARRAEHWCVPAQTAKRAAASLAALLGSQPLQSEPFAPMPSFWSDQFGVRLQAYGSPIGIDRWDVAEGSLSGDALPNGVVVAGYAGERIAYAVSSGVPAPVSMRYQRLIAVQQQRQEEGLRG